MNEPILSKSDINCLYQIVDEANKAYIKESHHTDKPSFNILRVLAALRLLYHESPSPLYNAIIYITKNYDPQSYYHWKKAIEELNRNRNSLFRSKSNYCRPEITNYTKTYQNSFNRSRVNDHEHQQSKSYAQINIQHEMHTSKQESFEEEDQKDISQTNAETGKRQFITKADSISHISKNHYISFEPYRNSIDHYRNQYYDKENINSTNIQQSRKKQSAYQYIQAIQRDLNRTTKNSQIKTPIDQSFIKNINSSESPFLYSKMNRQVSDPIQQQMVARANTFYQFNLKLKVFSSLQANSYVFLKAKQNQMKAQLQYNSKLMHLSFEAFTKNAKTQKQIRRKEEKADQFHSKMISRKVINVLKLVFSLAKDKNVQKVPNTKSYNKANFEFILSLLFTLNHSSEGEKVSQIDFDNKIMQLIYSDQTNKLYLIVKYFGKHPWISEQNIQSLIDLYKQSLCRLILNSLRTECAKNLKHLQIRQNNLKKQSFYALKIRWNRFACYKNKIKSAEAKRNRVLLEKVMKSLLQIVYSNKLYSKRCQYIQRKNLFQIKARAYKLWCERVKIQLSNKTQLNSKLLFFVQKLQAFIAIVSFNRIREEVKRIDQNIKHVIENNIKIRKNHLFKNMQEMIHQADQLRQSQKMMQRLTCATAISRWKTNTNKGKAISCIIKSIRIFYWRKLVLPEIVKSIETIKSIQSSQLDLQRKAFRQFVRFSFEEKNRRETLMKQLINRINFSRSLIAFSFFEADYQFQRRKKQGLIRREKAKQVKSLIKKSQEYMLVLNLFNLYQEKRENNYLKNTLFDSLLSSSARHCYKKLREINQNKANQHKLNKILFKNRALTACSKILSLIELSKIEKIKNLRKKKSSFSIGNIFSILYSQQCRKRQQAINYRNGSLCLKIFKGLELLVDQYRQISNIAQQYYSRKIFQYIKQSISNCRKITKVYKIYRKSQIRLTLKTLINKKSTKVDLSKLIEWKSSELRKQFINRLILSKRIQQERKQYFSKTILFQKWQGTTRLIRLYIRKLISKKHLYMALKFRALKLCLNSFKALALKRTRRRPLPATHKGLADRLSTDIAEFP